MEETSAEDAARSKPAPDIINVALGRIGEGDHTRAVMVGDSPCDAETAVKCGVPCLGVLCGGFQKEELLQAGCLAVYLDPAELLARYPQSILSS